MHFYAPLWPTLCQRVARELKSLNCFRLSIRSSGSPSVFSVLALASENGQKTCLACKSGLSFFEHSHLVLVSCAIVVSAVESTCQGQWRRDLRVGGAWGGGTRLCVPVCLSSCCRGTQTKQQPLDHAADVDRELRVGKEKDKKEGIVGGSWRELVVGVPASPLSGSVSANWGDPLRAILIDAGRGEGEEEKGAGREAIKKSSERQARSQGCSFETEISTTIKLL